MSAGRCNACFYSSGFYLIVTQLSALFSLGTALAPYGFCVLGTPASVHCSSFPLNPVDVSIHTVYCHCVVRHFLLLVLPLALWLCLSFVPILGFKEIARQLFPFHPLCDNTLDVVDVFRDPFKSSLFQTQVLNYSVTPCTEAAPCLGYPQAIQCTWISEMLLIMYFAFCLETRLGFCQLLWGKRRVLLWVNNLL